MHVLIVDNELLARNRLRVLLSDCEDPSAPFLVSEAATAAQALDVLQRTKDHHPVDLIFLDVQMPGQDGLRFAQTLRSLPRPPAVVFVTAHAMYSANAFEVEAVDYLTKPVRLDRLQQAVAKVRRLYTMEMKSPSSMPMGSAAALLIRDRGRTERVPLHQVIYLKAEQKYVTVRTATRSYILDNSLTELEGRYPQQFVRIHRNALVTREQMRSLEKHYTEDDGEGWALRMHAVPELLMVSRRQLSAVRAVMSQPLLQTQTEPA
ncbi:MAG: LytTR family DNA-binding domain-containing protein [Acidovorax sp.]|jgi:two-component system response regulator AlgR|nr:LytTR family DNA-binding domain-containing protein [Acidovorax sp.]MDR3004636.1 LytTR family DNA-binding domain-containing protein [Acidovorax sp.]